MNVYIDTEFSNVTERRVTPVCAVLRFEDGSTEGYWTHNDPDTQLRLSCRLYDLHTAGATFYSYSAESEARFLHAIGLNPIELRWVCLYIEWRQLLNHNRKLIEGMHLDDNGTPHLVTRFKGAPNYGYAGAVYRLLKQTIDTEHKTTMRELIISAPSEFAERDKEAILEYCASDTLYLPSLKAAMEKELCSVLRGPEQKLLRTDQLLRGNYAARTAVMVDTGYPINVEHTKNFSAQTQDILNELIEDILGQFPDIKAWRWDRKLSAYVMNQGVIREWIGQQRFGDWDRTDKGLLSLSLDAWKKYFSHRHDYPRGNFGAQMVRYCSVKQSLNGFMPSRSKSRRTFWDSVGSDGRARPYFGIYGAQSGRSQPGATGFIPLKSAWMRSLITPGPGKSIATIDYGSEEFLIAALLSKDKAMLEAYESGDVYLAFAKVIGMVPKAATKDSHPLERDICKATVLGLSYLMSKVGLAIKLTSDTGKYHSEEDAQKLINAFDEAYPVFSQYRTEMQEKYINDRYLRLPCGWAMFGGNDNFRSVANFPVQGMGSSILRKAVSYAQDAGLDVIFTLHDALSIEYPHGELSYIDTLSEAMDKAFRYYFPAYQQARATCRQDANTWGPENITGGLVTPKGMPVKSQQVYVDKRSKADYEKFSKYFTSPVDPISLL